MAIKVKDLKRNWLYYTVGNIDVNASIKRAEFKDENQQFLMTSWVFTGKMEFKGETEYLFCEWNQYIAWNLTKHMKDQNSGSREVGVRHKAEMNPETGELELDCFCSGEDLREILEICLQEAGL